MNKKQLHQKRKIKAWSGRMQRWTNKMSGKSEKIRLSNLSPRKPGESHKDHEWTIEGYRNEQKYYS